MPDLITFYHPLRTFTDYGHRVHSIKLTTLPERSHIVRDAVDKAPRGKYKRSRLGEKRVFPVFEPGMTTRAYIDQYHEMNKSRSGGSAAKWGHIGVNLKPVVYTTALDRPAPMLDPALPEMWEDIDAPDDMPDWLK